jgi:hypothetical protein
MESIKETNTARPGRMVEADAGIGVKKDNLRTVNRPFPRRIDLIESEAHLGNDGLPTIAGQDDIIQ